MKTVADFDRPEVDDVGWKVTLGGICWIALTSLTPRATNASPVTSVTATGVVCRLSETRRAVTTMSPTGTCSSCAACSAGGASVCAVAGAATAAVLASKAIMIVLFILFPLHHWPLGYRARRVP